MYITVLYTMYMYITATTVHTRTHIYVCNYEMKVASLNSMIKLSLYTHMSIIT